MKRFLFACAPLLLGFSALPALADAPPAAGPNFQVNVVSQGLQLDADVAQDTAGDMVTVWADLSNGAIKARLFTAAGAPRSDEIVVAPAGGSPRVAMTPLGDFVVAWEFLGHIYTRHFDPRGQTPIVPFDPLPNGISHSPDVAVDPAGNVYVVWADTHFDGDTIMLQRSGPNGADAPEQVNLPASFTRDNPRIAVDPSGSVLVSWDDFREEGGHHIDVLARRFDGPSGTWGPEIRINASTIGDQEGSAPILYDDGTGAVVFNDFQANAIQVRRVDAGGMPSGAPIPLGDLGAHAFFSIPGAAAGPDRTVLVAWLKGDALVRARFFDSSWSPLGEELTVSSDTTDYETAPAVSAGGLGSFAVVWTSSGTPLPTFPPLNNGRDGSGPGIFGQAYSSPSCAADSEILCLQNGRFQARVSWKNPFTGETGTGKTLPLTGDTGSFWFFDPANLELMVKVLDARGVNGYFWVYFGALSNVEYTLTLTDTATGATKTYHNAPFQLSSQADVTAFKDSPSAAALAAERAPLELKETATAEAIPSLPCIPTPTAFCARDRFLVEVSFIDPRNGTTGQGHATLLTDDTGVFWFFGPANLELMLKVLDGSAVNGHFWVFYGALSDVEYTITVTDTATGSQRTYHNPLHHLASGADLDAFTAGPTPAAR